MPHGRFRPPPRPFPPQRCRWAPPVPSRTRCARFKRLKSSAPRARKHVWLGGGRGRLRTRRKQSAAHGALRSALRGHKGCAGSRVPVPPDCISCCLPSQEPRGSRSYNPPSPAGPGRSTPANNNSVLTITCDFLKIKKKGRGRGGTKLAKRSRRGRCRSSSRRGCVHVEVGGQAGARPGRDRDHDRAARCCGTRSPPSPPEPPQRRPLTRGPGQRPAGRPGPSRTPAPCAFSLFKKKNNNIFFTLFTTKTTTIFLSGFTPLLAHRRTTPGRQAGFLVAFSPKWPRKICHHVTLFPVSSCKMYMLKMLPFVIEVRAFPHFSHIKRDVQDGLLQLVLSVLISRKHCMRFLAWKKTF